LSPFTGRQGGPGARRFHRRAAVLPRLWTELPHETPGGGGAPATGLRSSLPGAIPGQWRRPQRGWLVRLVQREGAGEALSRERRARAHLVMVRRGRAAAGEGNTTRRRAARLV